MVDHDSYQSPFSTRYASAEMRHNFSETKKFTTWRRLWIALAEAQQELGLDISDAQLEELRDHESDLDLEPGLDQLGPATGLLHRERPSIRPWEAGGKVNSEAPFERSAPLLEANTDRSGE